MPIVTYLRSLCVFRLTADALDDFEDEVSAAQTSEVSSVKQEAATTTTETQEHEDHALQEVRQAVTGLTRRRVVV
jgi:hypothetical protein